MESIPAASTVEMQGPGICFVLFAMNSLPYAASALNCFCAQARMNKASASLSSARSGLNCLAASTMAPFSARPLPVANFLSVAEWIEACSIPCRAQNS